MSLKKVKIDYSLAKFGYQTYDWETLFEIDDAESIYERGIRLLEGIGVRRAHREGEGMILEAAKMGHPLAMAKGIDLCIIKQKTERAFEILKECTNRGYTGACELLGCFYISSDCVESDGKEAVRLYTIASKDGYISATHRWRDVSISASEWKATSTRQTSCIAWLRKKAISRVCTAWVWLTETGAGSRKIRCSPRASFMPWRLWDATRLVTIVE